MRDRHEVLVFFAEQPSTELVQRVFTTERHVRTLVARSCTVSAVFFSAHKVHAVLVDLTMWCSFQMSVLCRFEVVPYEATSRFFECRRLYVAHVVGLAVLTTHSTLCSTAFVVGVLLCATHTVFHTSTGRQTFRCGCSVVIVAGTACEPAPTVGTEHPLFFLTFTDFTTTRTAHTTQRMMGSMVVRDIALFTVVRPTKYTRHRGYHIVVVRVVQEVDIRS